MELRERRYVCQYFRFVCFGESFVSCTVLMCLYFSLLGAPGAVNIHYIVWKFVSVLFKLSVSQSVNHVPLETDPVIFFG